MREAQGLDQLLRDPDYLRTYQQEKLILEATEQIAEAMKEAEVSKADLARRLGRTRSYITQILSGSRNMTLRTWADVLTALKKEARVAVVPLLRWGDVELSWSAHPQTVPAVKAPQNSCGSVEQQAPGNLAKNDGLAA